MALPPIEERQDTLAKFMDILAIVVSTATEEDIQAATELAQKIKETTPGYNKRRIVMALGVCAVALVQDFDRRNMAGEFDDEHHA